MTSTAATPTGHPIVGFANRLRRRLGELVDVPAWSMTPAEQRAVLVDLARARAQLEELRLRVLAAGDKADIAAESAATSTGAWLAHATRQPRGKAHADVTLALALEQPYVATRDALAAGVVDAEQARVIVHAVHRLREEAAEAVAADPSIPERAEKHLIGLAADYDARALKALGRHVFEVLDPDAADVQLGRKLEAQEAAAARKTYLELFDNGDGTHSGRFRLETLPAAMLRKAIEAFTNPTHHRLGATKDSTGAAKDPTGSTADPTGATATDRRRTRPELLGQAFAELLERLDPERLPTSGGLNATVVVLCDYNTLLTGLGTAKLDTGEPISASAARRLACQAGVIPAVIGRLVDGRSVVLDMGRKRRLFTEHQRIALTIEQGGCTAEACDRPAGWCHAHHDQAWSHGGGTDLRNGRLLCAHHHRKAHSTSYDTHHLPNGTIQFHRRT